MAKKYTIRAGFSFVMDDRSVKVGGDVVDLEDDIASGHAHKLELFDGGKKQEKKDKQSTKPVDAAPSTDTPPTGDAPVPDPA